MSNTTRRYPPTLETARLVLRPFTLVDANRVQRLAGDAAIADTTLNIPHPYEDGMAEEWIESHPQQFAEGRAATFAVVLKGAGPGLLVGAVGLEITPRFSRGEIGYWIGREYWGQGYCTEAARAVLRYAFEERGLHKVTGSHFARNPASGRVMEKIGMTREGYLREHVRKGDRYEDLVVWGILRSDWDVLQTRS